MELIGYNIVYEVYKNLKQQPVFKGKTENEAKMWAYQNYLEEFYIQPKYESNSLVIYRMVSHKTDTIDKN